MDVQVIVDDGRIEPVTLGQKYGDYILVKGEWRTLGGEGDLPKDCKLVHEAYYGCESGCVGWSSCSVVGGVEGDFGPFEWDIEKAINLARIMADRAGVPVVVRYIGL